MNQNQIVDELVREAERIVQDCSANLKKSNASSTGRTQLSNAIDAINQSGSIAVFRNWLRYQMKREEFWRTRGSQLTLAEHIDKYAQKLQEKYPDQAVRYLTLFLGFLRRTLVAIDYLNEIPNKLKGVAR